MNDIFIKTDYHNILEKTFPNKDLISIEDLLDMLDEQYYEIEHLKEELEDFKNPSEPDNYDAWHDQQLEEGVI